MNTEQKMTPAQIKIATAVVLYGYSNKMAAKHLNISPETVKTHLTHIYTKFGIKGRCELYKLADRLELLRSLCPRTILKLEFLSHSNPKTKRDFIARDIARDLLNSLLNETNDINH